MKLKEINYESQKDTRIINNTNTKGAIEAKTFLTSLGGIFVLLTLSFTGQMAVAQEDQSSEVGTAQIVPAQDAPIPI